MSEIKWIELSVEVNGMTYAVRDEAPPDIAFLRIKALGLVDRLEKIVLEREKKDPPFCFIGRTIDPNNYKGTR